MADTAQIIIIWILCHASIEISPSQDILLMNVSDGAILLSETYHRILLILDCFDGYLGQKVVMQRVSG